MRRFYMTLFVLIMLLSTSVSVPVYADGGFFKSREYMNEELYETGQKAIIVYRDNTETMLLQVKYEGNVSDFAWVVPVPGYPKVDTASVELFEDLAWITAPRASSGKSIGCGGVFGTSKTLVDVWEEGDIGIYHYAVLSADDSAALVNWLNDNGYAFPENGSGVIGEYINKGWYFVAAKIRAGAQGVGNEGLIEPLQLSFESEKIVYPLKISSLSSAETKVILYVFFNSSRAEPVEYQHVALYSNDQILHLPRKDNVFYQEYFQGIEVIEYEDERWYMDDIGWPLNEYSGGNFSDLLGNNSYFLTKLTAEIEAEQMVDITLVELNSEYVLDSDGDGWSDDEETIIGTNPYKADTDGDGTKDPWDGAPLYNRDVRIAIIVISVIILLISFYLLTYKHRFWRAIFSEIRKDWWKWIALIFFLALLVAFIMLGL